MSTSEGYDDSCGRYHGYIGGKNKLMTEFNECFGIEILCFVSH